ncbi:MAG: hypothetical protein KJO55_06775, partial [Gammaproteobacteria bacterium]|nr:hypothetical protein [Gammaproteobacteria bacterium]
WPNTGGVFTADVMVPLNFGGGGQWEVTIQSLWNNSGDIEGIVNASFTVGTQICELTLIGDMGTRVPGLAFDAGNKQLYGCANNGSLLSINKSNGNAVSFPSGSVDNCRAMTASNDASTTIFGGSGANNASMPGLLFTYDPADGTTTPIGENGFDSLSGLAITPADSDRDAVYDTVDNCLNLYNPSQRDTDFDGFGNHCDADIAPGENDCAINFIDLTALKGAFFSSEGSPTWNPDADFNGDGIVNFVDLTILKGQFFGQPGPSGIMPQCLPCVQGDTGFDHAESFGDELFLRGTFNNWAAPPQAKLINQQPGSGRYQARMYFDAGIHEYKMASADWATEYDDPPTTTTPGVAIEYAGGAADSSANIPLDVPTRGCYVFDIEATEPVPAPTPSVIVEMNRFPY